MSYNIICVKLNIYNLLNTITCTVTFEHNIANHILCYCVMNKIHIKWCGLNLHIVLTKGEANKGFSKYTWGPCIKACISILDFSVQALSTRRDRPPISYPLRFRIALRAVSWSLYSQKPYPLGLPVSRSNTNLNESTGPTSLNISFSFSSVAS